jgi:ABC-type transport system involved in multi-copper enzyme maturation permease subunit
MTLKIAKKELLSNLMDFKFFLVLLITIITFSASGLILTSKYLIKVKDYSNLVDVEQDKIKKKCGSISQLLNHEQVVYLNNNPLEFVISGNVLFLPNTLVVSALSMNTQTMTRGSAQSNPLLESFADIDWIFIIGVILSFAAVIFSYDSISGEKENKTLGVILSNYIKRHQILFGKFLGGFITIMIPLVIGVIINLLIVILYFQHYIKIELFLFIFLILVSAAIYISFFLWLGILVSSICQKSITSFAFLFFLWVLFVIIIPKSTGILGSLFHPIMNQTQIRQMQESAEMDIIKKYKDNYGKVDFSKPFAKETALWVKSMNEISEVYGKIGEKHLNEMIAQAEAARNFSLISPYSVFKYTAENIANSGIPRIKRFLEIGKEYRQDLLNALIIEDKKDPGSPHLLHSYFFSKRPIDYGKIPKFKMKEYQPGDLLVHSMGYIFLLLTYCIVMFSAAYMFFSKYDVR